MHARRIRAASSPPLLISCCARREWRGNADAHGLSRRIHRRTSQQHPYHRLRHHLGDRVRGAHPPGSAQQARADHQLRRLRAPLRRTHLAERRQLRGAPVLRQRRHGRGDRPGGQGRHRQGSLRHAQLHRGAQRVPGARGARQGARRMGLGPAGGRRPRHPAPRTRPSICTSSTHAAAPASPSPACPMDPGHGRFVETVVDAGSSLVRVEGARTRAGPTRPAPSPSRSRPNCPTWTSS